MISCNFCTCTRMFVFQFVLTVLMLFKESHCSLDINNFQQNHDSKQSVVNRLDSNPQHLRDSIQFQHPSLHGDNNNKLQDHQKNVQHQAAAPQFGHNAVQGKVDNNPEDIQGHDIQDQDHHVLVNQEPVEQLQNNGQARELPQHFQGFQQESNFVYQDLSAQKKISNQALPQQDTFRQDALPHYVKPHQPQHVARRLPPGEVFLNQGQAYPFDQGFQQPQVRVRAPPRNPNNKDGDHLLSRHPSCINDIHQICDSQNYNLANNVDVLECLSLEENVDDISEDCHHVIWIYKVNMTQSDKLHTLVNGLCQEALKIHPACIRDKPDGTLTSCLLEHREDIADAACVDLLTKLEVIIFNDYHLIDGFIKSCQGDVVRLRCGKLDSRSTDGTDKEIIHTQEDVVNCLEDHLDDDQNSLSPACDLQITRLAELSANDYHLDRHVYVSCKNDRESFCSDVVAGEGKVYKCLFEHKFDAKMSAVCRGALTNRQNLIGKDYKASYALGRICQKDIEKKGCGVPAANGNHLSGTNPHVHLSAIILCLENNDAPSSKECEAELMSYRRMLLRDYQMTPEITAGCATEISQHCENGLEKDGRTLHCLLSLDKEGDGLTAQCSFALESLVKESEVVKDYRMDPVLVEDCHAEIKLRCSEFVDGDPLVLGCMLEHLNDIGFDRKCRQSLIELQYFIARDFSVDPEFREVCLQDAKHICKSDQVAEPRLDTEVGVDSFHLPFNLVMSCLYRNIKSTAGNEHNAVSKECAEKVHELIKQRALDVNLNPDLEKACRHDLGEFCSLSPHHEGTEFRCLQDRLEELRAECRKEVEKLTKDEGENVMDFDAVLVQECKAMLDQYCGDFLRDNDEGIIMQCLIDNKANMESEKCAAGITHFQLVEMKDFHMNYNFLKECTADVKKFCNFESHQSEAEIIKCLSKHKRDHVVSDGKSDSLSPGCSAEITLEKLQMHENIMLNSFLHENCSEMQKKYCNQIKTGEAEVIECLRQHKDDLDKRCYKALFTFEEEESLDPQLDFKLMHTCKETIDALCLEEMQDEEADYVFECLVRNKHKINNKQCETVVVEREKEMFSDLSLNVQLEKACNPDILHHCGDARLQALQDHVDGKDPHGVIYECLKEKYASENLTPSCHEHVEVVIREQQSDYRLDPQLVLKCTNTIEKLCHPNEEGNVVECLKKNYFSNEMQKEKQCMLEVAKLLKEGHTDIKADPILEETCLQDLKQHCSGVPEGHGRLIACLVMVADDESRSLSVQCGEEIAARRAMWNKVDGIKSVKGFKDLHHAVQESEHFSYITSVLFFSVLVILILGIFCGRISRKITKLRNKRRVF